MLTHFSLKHFMGIFLSHFPQGCYLWVLVQNQIVCIKKYHILLPRRGKWARVGELKDRCDVPKGLWLLWIFSHPHLAPAFFQHVPSVTFWPLSGRLPIFSLSTVYLFILNPRIIQRPDALLSVALYGLSSRVVPGILLWADGCLFFSCIPTSTLTREDVPV